MDKTPIVLSWLLTHLLVFITHIRILRLTDSILIDLCSVIFIGIIHNYVARHFNKVYTDIKKKEESC